MSTYGYSMNKVIIIGSIWSTPRRSTSGNGDLFGITTYQRLPTGLVKAEYIYVLVRDRSRDHFHDMRSHRAYLSMKIGDVVHVEGWLSRRFENGGMHYVVVCEKYLHLCFVEDTGDDTRGIPRL